MTSTLIATIGVSMLLLAFFLHLIGFMKLNSWGYLLMNFFGAGLSCYASYLISFLPFIILEATWAAVAAVAIGRKIYFVSEN
ncbi:MAG TPA: hypothetical protein VE978_28600 [Chitinophagales bacterium]|nr:hypothetical protein [Chitinophagales bacterium]